MKGYKCVTFSAWKRKKAGFSVIRTIFEWPEVYRLTTENTAWEECSSIIPCLALQLQGLRRNQRPEAIKPSQNIWFLNKFCSWVERKAWKIIRDTYLNVQIPRYVLILPIGHSCFSSDFNINEICTAQMASNLIINMVLRGLGKKEEMLTA
jgi:hypothetical protein